MATIDELMRVAPVIPVIVIDDIAHAVPLAEALVAGGLRVLEVTLRTPAALPAIAARWGASLSQLPADHPGHAIIADTIAQACHILFASVAVAEVVIGGGVANTTGLVERVAERARALDAGYLPGGPRHRIIRPRHGENAGIIGALMLAAGVSA